MLYSCYHNRQGANFPSELPNRLLPSWRTDGWVVWQTDGWVVWQTDCWVVWWTGDWVAWWTVSWVVWRTVSWVVWRTVSWVVWRTDCGKGIIATSPDEILPKLTDQSWSCIAVRIFWCSMYIYFLNKNVWLWLWLLNCLTTDGWVVWRTDGWVVWRTDGSVVWQLTV